MCAECVGFGAEWSCNVLVFWSDSSKLSPTKCFNKQQQYQTFNVSEFVSWDIWNQYCWAKHHCRTLPPEAWRRGCSFSSSSDECWPSWTCLCHSFQMSWPESSNSLFRSLADSHYVWKHIIIAFRINSSA